MTLVVTFSMQGQPEQSIELTQSPVMIGSLLSNQLILSGPGIEPIHALLERKSETEWILTDLGSESGVQVNGKSIDVEQKVSAGDSVTIGSVKLSLGLPTPPGPDLPPAPPEMKLKTPAPPPPDAKPKASPPKKEVQGDAKKAGPSRKAPPAAMKDIPQAKASPAPPGKPAPKAAPGKPAPKAPVKARPSAPVRQGAGGGIEPPVTGKKEDLLFSPKDAKPSGDVLEIVAYWGNTILEVEHFHPSLKDYSRVTIGDPTKAHFLAAGDESFEVHELATLQGDGYRLNLLSSMTARLRRGGSVERVEGGNHTLGCRDISHIKHGPIRYFFLFMRPPTLSLPKKTIDDPFFLGIMAFSMVFFFLFTITLGVTEPEEQEDIHSDIWSIVHIPEKMRKIKKETEKEVKLVEIKKEPPPSKEPPKPEPKPVEPVKVEEEAKPVEKEKPQEKQVAKANMMDNLKKAKAEPPPPPPGAKDEPKKPSGASAAMGNRADGGKRRGDQKSDVKGIDGVKNEKSSGVNLGKLGLGVGKIKSAKGAGAVYTKFRNSAGGAGGGAGSGKKTFGLGGVGSSVKTLGLAGSGNAMDQFGSSSKGFLGKGQGKGLGTAFGSGKRQAQVNVSAGDPLVSGGLTQQEIMGVIRAELNQIRHCYEKLLQRSPNASGKVKVRFKVGTNGRVLSANVVSSSISDGTLKGCVIGVVRRWKFPPPRGGSAVTVNYPFTFNPI